MLTVKEDTHTRAVHDDSSRLPMLPALRDIVHPSLLPVRRSVHRKEPFASFHFLPQLDMKHPLAVKLCSVPHCNKRARVRGKCCGHGGRNVCSEPGCHKCARAGGRCIKHGGGLRCMIKDCNKAVQTGGVCYAHREFRKSPKTKPDSLGTFIMDA